ncbi:MAG: LysM peptidoglycan-binding domain-containing protein [Flavobacteriales bacterium]
MNGTTPFRVIHFGDSHIQGDRISGELRNTFQKIGGNGGMGIIFPYSLCGSSGPLGTENSVSGSSSYSTIVKNPKAQGLGVMGYELTLAKNAKLTMKFNEKFKGVPTRTIALWIQTTSDTSMAVSMDSTWTFLRRDSLNENVYCYYFESLETPNKVDFKANTSLSFWGLEFQSKQGVTYQQNGVIGAQFSHLIAQEKAVLTQLKYLKPDLLVFSFGTNEAYSDLDTMRYERMVSGFIAKLMVLFPNTGILISNAPDTRSAGKTPKNQRSVNRTLYRITQSLGISYYDLNSAMGGWGSLYSWQKKGRVYGDLLHFNTEGATLLGKLISQAVVEGTLLNTAVNQSLRDEIFQALCVRPEPIKPPKPIDTLPTKIDTNLTQVSPAPQPKPIVTKPQPKPIPVPIPKPPVALKPTPKPNKPNPKETPKPKSPQKPVPGSRIYVVKKGDTLSEVAEKTGASMTELRRLNGIKSDNIIRIGQKLKY